MEIEIHELLRLIEDEKERVLTRLLIALREDNLKPEDQRDILISSGKIKGLDMFSSSLKNYIDQKKEKKHG